MQTTAASRKPLVLHVDDDPRQQKLVQVYLTRNGFDVAFAGSGKEAIAALKTTKPDLVLLDVIMPGMDGYEVCAKLQEGKATAAIPVIFATALGEEQDKARAFAVGAVDYIIKPFQKSSLLDKIAAALKSSAQWQEAASSAAPAESVKIHAEDFQKFLPYLCDQLSLSPADRNGILRASAQTVYTECSKVGAKTNAVAQNLAEFLKLPYVPRINSKDVRLGALPAVFCRSNQIVPLNDVAADIALVVANPFTEALSDLMARFSNQGVACRLMITEPENIMFLFAQAVSRPEEEAAGAGIIVASGEAVKGADGSDVHDLAQSAMEAPIINLANALIARGVHGGASDVHIEPRESSVGVRYRIDGMLHEQDSIPKKIQASLVSRFKIMAGMDIVERRVPQDGRIRIIFQNRSIDLRVSTLPARHGEKVVIRILDGGGISLDFDALGFEENALKLFRKAIVRPTGIILLTGPTGSGKSTTLYSALQAVNQPHLNIVTVEDPVEYAMHRVTQVQVHPEAGLTFPIALRHILRQDPDVIMVGEIRDRDTVDIAIKAALTGHLVLSTLHTNDAPSTVTRLIDMGMESYLVAAALELIVAQRLMRRLCPHCKKPIEVGKETFAHFEMPVASGVAFHQAAGCGKCHGTGFGGRMLAEEVMPVDEGMRGLISRRATLDELRHYAVDRFGMLTLRQSAFLKAARGLTSLEEVIRVTG